LRAALEVIIAGGLRGRRRYLIRVDVANAVQRLWEVGADGRVPA
jgi:hypothetical protein